MKIGRVYPRVRPIKWGYYPVLSGNYTLAAFNADLTALRNLFASWNLATETATLKRKTRDAQLAPLRKRLVEYRQVAQARLNATDPLAMSLPALTVHKGATPDAVSVSGRWDATTNKGILTWVASTNTDLAGYQIRTAPPPTYRTKDETVVGDVGTETLTFATETGLAAPGSTALFRVYVVTNMGNVRGSATVKIVRP